jgi:phage shock protein PspC (stress-responsive transcriptional regulator)
VLTWWEWVEHHPPEIVIVALVHFVFLFAVIALLVYVGLWFRARRSTTSRTPP